MDESSPARGMSAARGRVAICSDVEISALADHRSPEATISPYVVPLLYFPLSNPRKKSIRPKMFTLGPLYCEGLRWPYTG